MRRSQKKENAVNQKLIINELLTSYFCKKISNELTIIHELIVSFSSAMQVLLKQRRNGEWIHSLVDIQATEEIGEMEFLPALEDISAPMLTAKLFVPKDTTALQV